MSEYLGIAVSFVLAGGTADSGAVFLYMIKARKYLWELVEKVTGARMTVSYCRVGGVKADLPEDFAEPEGLLRRPARFSPTRMGFSRGTAFSWTA